MAHNNMINLLFRNTAFILLAIFVIITAGCAKQSRNETPNSTFSFDGYWEGPAKRKYLFDNNAFVFFDPDSPIPTNGIFRKTETQCFMNGYYSDGFFITTTVMDYAIISGKLRLYVADDPLDMFTSHWARYDDLNADLAEKTRSNPMIGYWERIDGNEIIILHFFPPWMEDVDRGLGFEYTCDLNYDLQSQERLYYDIKTPLTYYKNINVDDEHSFDDWSMLPKTATVKLDYFCIMEGDDLLVSGSDEPSEYVRYKKNAQASN